MSPRRFPFADTFVARGEINFEILFSTTINKLTNKRMIAEDSPAYGRAIKCLVNHNYINNYTEASKLLVV